MVISPLRGEDSCAVEISSLGHQEDSNTSNTSKLEAIQGTNYSNIRGLVMYRPQPWDMIEKLSPSQRSLWSKKTMPSKLKSWEVNALMVQMLLPSWVQIRSKSLRDFVNEGCMNAWVFKFLISCVKTGARKAILGLPGPMAASLIVYVTLNMISRKVIKNYIPSTLLPKPLAEFARVYGAGPLVKNALYPNADAEFSIEKALENPDSELDSVLKLTDGAEVELTQFFCAESVWGKKLKAEAELLRGGESFNRAFDCFNDRHVSDRDVFKLFKGLFSELLIVNFPNPSLGSEDAESSALNQIKQSLFNSVQKSSPERSKKMFR